MQFILSKDAKKQYLHLKKTEQAKVYKKLLALEDNPYLGKKLSGELVGIYSLRVWPYRILYEINQDKKRVEVHKISHRQGAYK